MAGILDGMNTQEEGSRANCAYIRFVLTAVFDSIDANLDGPRGIAAIDSQVEQYRDGSGRDSITLRVGHLGKLVRAAGREMNERGCVTAKHLRSAAADDLGNAMLAVARCAGDRGDIGGFFVRVNPNGLRGAEITFGRMNSVPAAHAAEDVHRGV